MVPIARRRFLQGAAAVLAASSIPAASLSPAAAPPLCVFSKHLQFIRDWSELAETYRGLGLDAADLTVRPGGHIEPADAARELPKAVAAFQAAGLSIAMITTSLQSGDDPEAKTVLAAAAENRIPFFRFGTGRYDETGPIAEQLAAYQRGMASLAALAEEFGLRGGYHNHSGPRYIGAALWDLDRMLEAVGSPALGSNFDLGHATAEGAMGAGLTAARMLAPRVHMSAVKDFVWNEEGRVQWVPMGDGVVPTAEYFRILRAAGFHGPVSIHFEYKTADNETLLRHMAAAAAVTRAALTEAGYPA